MNGETEMGKERREEKKEGGGRVQIDRYRERYIYRLTKNKNKNKADCLYPFHQQIPSSFGKKFTVEMELHFF